jgi:hypothetical protein
VNEEAVLFGEQRSLAGIVTYPEKAAKGAPAVILLTAGLVHRVGPNHLYASLCRAAAAAGHVALRFDFSGIGDSEPRTDYLPFHTTSVLEAQQAMDFLSTTTKAERFVLVGLCSGASAVIFTASQDYRVVGGIVINAQTFEEDGEEELLDYAEGRALTRYIFSPYAWLKVFKGTARFKGKAQAVAKHLLAGLRRNHLAEKARAAGERLFALAERDLDLLMIYSKGDRGLDYFNLLGRREIERLQRTGRVRVEILYGTDHLFTPPEARKELFGLCLKWLERYRLRQRDARSVAALTV